MAYTPRLTAPSTTDKHWIHTSGGGYNSCIRINGTYSCLPNCFTGDTEIITNRGRLALNVCVGEELMIPTMLGIWRKAIVQHFGKQRIWKVYLTNGHVYSCTGNHRWVIFEENGYDHKFVETHDLFPGMMIKYSFHMNYDDADYTRVDHIEITDRVENVYCPVEPETHMCTLGGGELTGQCVGYAWGRFMEILGSTPKLSLGNANMWYGNTQDGYERGQTPKLGAVICWDKIGGAGHVAIVEQINNDGSIVTSNSAYGGWRFYTETLYPPKYSIGSAYVLQGFIYNPAVSVEDKLSLFLKEACSHVGEGGSWAWRMYNSHSGTNLGTGWAWCAAFVDACAWAVGGLVGVIIPQTTIACMSRYGVREGMGQYYLGPHLGGTARPQPGDLIQYRWNKWAPEDIVDIHSSDHVGIVREVSDTTVYTVEGNVSGGVVAYRQKSLTDPTIHIYFRPDWSKVGASVGNIATTPTMAPLYDSETTREDALLREIGYMGGGTPTINTTQVRLSAINYTTPLAAFFNSYYGVNGQTSLVINYDALPSVQRAIVEFFEDKGFRAAASIGMLACLDIKSGLDTSFQRRVMVRENGEIQYVTQYGIFRWEGERAETMKKNVGSNWKNNLTGQLTFLYNELQLDYPMCLKALNTVTNNDSGARSAADIIYRQFELGTNDDDSSSRQEQASAYWSQVVVQLTGGTDT